MLHETVDGAIEVSQAEIRSSERLKVLLKSFQGQLSKTASSKLHKVPDY